MPDTDATTTTTTISTKEPVFDVDQFTRDTAIVVDNDFVDSDGEKRTLYKVTGNGTFDKMMETVHKHLTALLMSNGIRKEDYAKLYSELLKDTMQVAVVAEEKANNNALVKRQIQGYNEAYKKDMFKIMCDSWAVGFSASEEAFYDETVASKAIPTPLTSTEISNIYNKFIAPEFDEGISYTPDQTMSVDKTTTTTTE